MITPRSQWNDWIISLTPGSYHDANFIIISGTVVDCHNDNIWCCQWWQSWYYDNFFSVQVQHFSRNQIDGLVQDCSNSIANALELLQSCTKPSKLSHHHPSTHSSMALFQLMTYPERMKDSILTTCTFPCTVPIYSHLLWNGRWQYVIRDLKKEKNTSIQDL